jgi:hypothetical protein
MILKETIEISEFKTLLIKTLKSIRVNSLKVENEEDLENKLIDILNSNKIIKKKGVKRQQKNTRFKVIKPDLVIGDNEYLIELKYLRKNTTNDIYFTKE